MQYEYIGNILGWFYFSIFFLFIIFFYFYFFHRKKGSKQNFDVFDDELRCYWTAVNDKVIHSLKNVRPTKGWQHLNKPNMND